MKAKRLWPRDLSPELYTAVAQVDALVRKSGLEASLVELVKIRASQINNCAFCLDTHTRDARKGGESEQRIYLLNGWREAEVYTPRERAALGWTEALTLLTQTQAEDHHYAPLLDHFDEKGVVDLTILIGLINLWNRLAVGMRYSLPNVDGTQVARDRGQSE